MKQITLYKVINRKEQFIENMKIEYYLFSSSFKDEDSLNYISYGIEIRLFRDGILVDETHIEDISTLKSNCNEILSRLAKNIVTPISLKDLLDDILGTV